MIYLYVEAKFQILSQINHGRNFGRKRLVILYKQMTLLQDYPIWHAAVPKPKYAAVSLVISHSLIVFQFCRAYMA